MEGKVEVLDSQPKIINVTWDVTPEEVHATTNDYNLRSKGPVAQGNTPQVPKSSNKPCAPGKSNETSKGINSGNSNSVSTPAPSTSQPITSINYDIVEDMKKTRANISIYDLAQLTSQKNLIFKALGGTKTNVVNNNDTTPGQAKQANNVKMLKTPSINSALIGQKS